MKTVFVVAALAALAAAGPAKHRRGACPAKVHNTVDGGDSQTTANWSKPTNSDSGKNTDNDTDTGATDTGAAVCPNDGGKTLKSSGSCGCDYSINCNSKADHGSSTQFWEKTSGQIVLSLAECVAMCDENSDCKACIW